MRYDALVIGAGPAGSATALLLTNAGWRVGLVEKSEFPRRKVCGEFISAAALKVLDRCGIGEDFRLSAGPPVTHAAFYAGRTRAHAPLPDGGGRALGRETLDTLLRDAAVKAGTTLFQPAEVLSVARDDGGFLCALADGCLQTRRVIGATGSWRKKPPFAMAVEARASDLLGFKAHWRGAKLPAGLMPLLAFAGGYGGMVETSAHRLSLSLCIRRDALAHARARHGGRAADAAFAHLREQCDGAAEALGGAEMEQAPLAAGPIRPGIRPRFRNGLFFVGNLAGEAHPVIAEGISMALEGAALLAAILIAEPDAQIAGRAYAQAWGRRFAPRIAAAALIAQVAMRAPLRATAAQVLTWRPALLSWGAGLAGKG